MSESDVRLMEVWAEQLACAPDPVGFEYENVWAPDIDYRAIEGAPDDVGPILGRDAMRRYTAEWQEMFDDFAGVAEEVIDAGDGLVITIVTIRDGRIVRGREFLTREEALKAAESRD